MLKVDTRGMSCPQPVLMVKKALSDNAEIEVLTDSPSAEKNIIRYADDNNYKLEKTDSEDYTLLTIKR